MEQSLDNLEVVIQIPPPPPKSQWNYTKTHAKRITCNINSTMDMMKPTEEQIRYK